MAFILHFRAALVLFVIMFPIVSSSVAGKNCSNQEFWSKQNGCCLPHGGPASPPRPPKGTECPSLFYWGSNRGCCLPRHPYPENGPLPQCPKGWTWNQYVRKCLPTPTPPKPTHPPKPSDHYGGQNGNGSGSWGGGGNGNNYGNGNNDVDHGYGRKYRRGLLKARTGPLCPSGLEACPINGLHTGNDFECVDTETDLRSCGGCGQDCNAIQGAWNVACDQGSCKVSTCASGYNRSDDGKACIRN